MPRIQRLPATLVNQIAAGEVVERPASVVKELLENVVDAGGSRIDVEISQGGADRIQVVDDGCGIAAEDLPLAFASHATSKLDSADDLFRIGTLGFRGEALASVGSIAQVSLQSRPAGQATGAHITCHGGQLGPVTPWNGAAGTRIEVRHLFYNTPARRKFLRSQATEMGHVAEAFTRMALARPGLHLSLRHNHKAVHDVPGPLGLLDRIGLLFGAEVAAALYRVEARQGEAALDGYVADPACARGDSRLQYLFVNGRWVRDRGLFQAVQEAFRGLLMAGRYPVAFLSLQLPAGEVDVNVHPAKAEVRFRARRRCTAWSTRRRDRHGPAVRAVFAVARLRRAGAADGGGLQRHRGGDVRLRRPGATGGDRRVRLPGAAPGRPAAAAGGPVVRGQLRPAPRGVRLPGESWRALDDALRRGHRWLPGGESLARLLRRHRDGDGA
jgi:DNA mismatch repair protein MutL